MFAPSAYFTFAGESSYFVVSGLLISHFGCIHWYTTISSHFEELAFSYQTLSHTRLKVLVYTFRPLRRSTWRSWTAPLPTPSTSG